PSFTRIVAESYVPGFTRTVITSYLVLSELSLDHMSPVLSGPLLYVMSTLFSTLVDINSPIDFLLSLVTNFSSDHQPSEQGSLIENNNINNGIIINTDLKESENPIDTSGLNNDITFVRTSQKDEDVIQCATLECSRSGIHNPQITSFVDNHNYVLSTTIYEIAPRFRKLTPKMLSDIEKYVIQGWMDSGSIYPLFKHDYPNNSIFKKDLYNA
ncbi:2734_t:CDS:2, partial [Cetraspora pellucida]